MARLKRSTGDVAERDPAHDRAVADDHQGQHCAPLVGRERVFDALGLAADGETGWAALRLP